MIPFFPPIYNAISMLLFEEKEKGFTTPPCETPFPFTISKALLTKCEYVDFGFGTFFSIISNLTYIS